MGQALGQMLPFAVGVALSPLPIIAVVLILLTPDPLVKALLFGAGCVLGVALVGGVLLVVARPAGADDAVTPTWVGVVKLLLGLGLLAVSVKQWRKRPAADDEPELPAWMGALDDLSRPRAFGLGVLLAGLNPKNLVLLVAGAAAVAPSGASAGEQAVAWAVFTAIASLGVALPIGLYLRLGDRAEATLASLETWVARHSSVVMAVICLLLGVMLLGDAVPALTA